MIKTFKNLKTGLIWEIDNKNMIADLSKNIEYEEK